MSQRGWSLAVFVTGLLLMQCLQVYYLPFAYRGAYYQEHSSEDMMQTVSLLDLRDRPGQTLLALHIQPPLLDGLRALLARLWPALKARALVVQVDRSLYFIWMIVYASMGVLVFRWLWRLGSSSQVAALAALGFFLHPAAIFYATFLEGTLLTSLGILWLCYALWRIPARGATLSLFGAYLLLFLVRSIFQWPALVVLVAALLLRQAPRRSILVFALSSATVVGAFMSKQYLVFGSTMTSSFAGLNCLEALGAMPELNASRNATTALGPLYRRTPPGDLPAVLTRETKITGAHNFNHLADLAHERTLLGRCRERLASDSPWSTLRAWSHNASIFFQPSSRYVTPHVIADRLPWRPVFDWLFSGLRLVCLLALGTLVWLRGQSRSELLRGLGLALPVLFVFAVCAMFEREENMRFKFFVEPVVYVFLVTQAVTAVRARRSGRAPGEAAVAKRQT